MATVLRILLVGDLNSSIEDVAAAQFNLQCISYEINLSAANQERLRDKPAGFFKRGTPVRPPSGLAARQCDASSRPFPSSRERTSAIRDRAKSAGREIRS